MNKKLLFVNFKALLGFCMLSLLSGCDYVLLNPQGDIALQQRDLVIYSTGLMLLIIVPVIGFTLFFAWKYSEKNKKDVEYDPEWHHSTKLEIMIWTVPLMIIMVLGTMTWIATHRLDPYRPIDRLSAEKQLDDQPTLIIEVVALDWKWMFLYPQYDIATVNEVAAPLDRPIQFKITSETSMNSLYIPTLAGQIYAMKGMETQLHAVINKAGIYDGFSANYSGAGFSHMYFKFHGMPSQDFDQWVEKIKTTGQKLNSKQYLEIAEPTTKHPVQYFANVETTLYNKILNMCANPNDMCADDRMYVDEVLGGGGMESVSYELAKLSFSNICRTDDPPLALNLSPSSKQLIATMLSQNNLGNAANQ